MPGCSYGVFGLQIVRNCGLDPRGLGFECWLDISIVHVHAGVVGLVFQISGSGMCRARFWGMLWACSLRGEVGIFAFVGLRTLWLVGANTAEFLGIGNVGWSFGVVRGVSATLGVGWEGGGGAGNWIRQSVQGAWFVAPGV